MKRSLTTTTPTKYRGNSELNVLNGIDINVYMLVGVFVSVAFMPFHRKIFVKRSNDFRISFDFDVKCCCCCCCCCFRIVGNLFVLLMYLTNQFPSKEIDIDSESIRFRLADGNVWIKNGCRNNVQHAQNIRRAQAEKREVWKTNNMLKWYTDDWICSVKRWNGHDTCVTTNNSAVVSMCQSRNWDSTELPAENLSQIDSLRYEKTSA